MITWPPMSKCMATEGRKNSILTEKRLWKDQTQGRTPICCWVWPEGDRIIDTLWEGVFKHSNKHTPLVQPKHFAGMFRSPDPALTITIRNVLLNIVLCLILKVKCLFQEGGLIAEGSTSYLTFRNSSKWYKTVMSLYPVLPRLHEKVFFFIMLTSRQKIPSSPFQTTDIHLCLQILCLASLPRKRQIISSKQFLLPRQGVLQANRHRWKFLPIPLQQLVWKAIFITKRKLMM